MEPYTYTAADLEVERGLADWGSPQATVTVKTGPLAGEVYRLRSPKGIPMPDGTRLDREHDHYMLDLLTNRHGHDVQEVRGFYGSYPTDDLDTALGYLPETLTEWVADEVDRWQLSSVLHELGTAIGDATEYDTRRSRHSLRERWPRVRQLVLAAEMQLYPKPETPPMPLPDHWVWQAPLLVLERPTADGRLLSNRGSYTLMGGGAVVGGDPRTGGQRTEAHILNLRQCGCLVWASGVALSAAMAADITAGRRFLSATLTADPDQGQDFSGPLQVWYGGFVLGAHLKDADQNPWGGWHA